MATLMSVTQSNQIVKEAYEQSTGLDAPAVLNLSGIVDEGNKELFGYRDIFTKALFVKVAKHWFTDTSAQSTFNDPYFVDTDEFKLIVEMIDVEIPDAQENSAWKSFVSGTTTVGTYTVYIPVVDTKYYAKTSAWALPLTISWEQWKPCFEDEVGLNSFVNYIFMCVDNKLLQHRKDMNNANRNNATMERMLSTDVKLAFNLVEEYAKTIDASKAMTVDEAFNNPDFFRFAPTRISNMCAYFKEQTACFNTDGKVKFTPNDRLVVEVLKDFETRIDSIGRATLFHNEMVKLPNYSTVAFWQGIGDTSFDNISTISVKNGDNTITKKGIVAVINDKWAIMHTIKSNRVAAQPFPIENITLYEYQNVDMYLNNLSMNGVVFYVEDYVPA